MTYKRIRKFRFTRDAIVNITWEVVDVLQHASWRGARPTSLVHASFLRDWLVSRCLWRPGRRVAKYSEQNNNTSDQGPAADSPQQDCFPQSSCCWCAKGRIWARARFSKYLRLHRWHPHSHSETTGERITVFKQEEFPLHQRTSKYSFGLSPINGGFLSSYSYFCVEHCVTYRCLTNVSKNSRALI